MIIRNACLLAAESIAKEKKELFKSIFRGSFIDSIKANAGTWELMLTDIEDSAEFLGLGLILESLGTKTLANALCAALLPEDKQLWAILQQGWDQELSPWDEVSKSPQAQETQSMLRRTAFEIYLKAFDEGSAKDFAKIDDEEALALIDWLHAVRKKLGGQVARTLV